MKCIAYSVKWKFQGGGGGGRRKDAIGGGGGGGGVSNLKVPSVGGMDIFWNYTIIDVFSILLTASVRTCQLSRIK